MNRVASVLDRGQNVRKAHWLLRHPLTSYFLLAYLISWGLSLLATRGLLPFPVPPLVGAVAGFLYHFGPSLAGVILAAVEAGRRGVRSLLRPLGRLRVGIAWYLFVVSYPILLRLAAAGIGAALGGPAPTFFTSNALGMPAGHPLVIAPLVFLGTLIFAGLAEEIGWRGYALPRLQSRYSALAASLILAAVWAPWHYNPLNFPLMRGVLVGHMLSVLGMTILLTWVYNGTGGSLGLTVLFHGFSNFADWAVPTSPVYGGDVRTYGAYILLNLIVAATIVLIFGGTNLSRRAAVRHL